MKKLSPFSTTLKSCFTFTGRWGSELTLRSVKNWRFIIRKLIETISTQNWTGPSVTVEQLSGKYSVFFFITTLSSSRFNCSFDQYLYDSFWFKNAFIKCSKDKMLNWTKPRLASIAGRSRNLRTRMESVPNLKLKEAMSGYEFNSNVDSANKYDEGPYNFNK